MGFVKQLWHSVPAEVGKGALKGQWIRLTNMRRYKELMEIRGPREQLVGKKKELLRTVKDELKKSGICAKKVYARIKTIGSLDRKERYSRALYPSGVPPCMKEDLMGLTIIVATEQEAYDALGAIKRIGSFPTLGYRPNPRNYFNRSLKHGRIDQPDAFRVGFSGQLSVEGFPCQIHARILLTEHYPIHNEARGKYIRAVWKRIKESEEKVPAFV